MQPGFEDAVKSGMVRDKPEIDPARAALVKRWQSDVETAKAHWRPDFKRMRDNMDMVSGKQWPGQAADDDRYVANIVQRVIKTSVASLYAKNPKVTAKRRPQLDYIHFDGDPQTIKAALADLAHAEQTGQPPQPISMQILQEVKEVTDRHKIIDKIGKTLEVLAGYYMGEQIPGFKLQMKQMIRRTRTTGVGYVELGFQRQMDLSDDQTTRISDMTEQLATIGRLAADLQDGKFDENSAKAEELRLAMAAIQASPEKIIREGLIWAFPQSTRIIPAPETQILTGWVGAPWIAKEILLTVDRVKEVYGVDLGDNYSSYKIEPGRPYAGSKARSKARSGLACVWHIFDRDTGLEYVIADGYPEFLQEPTVPSVQVEQFFPIFPIAFNEVENEGELFPKSDVELLKHQQREYNRSKEGQRQHRIANRPLYLAGKGTFDEDDQKNLASSAAHDVIMVNAMKDGVKAEDLVSPVKKIGVDPNLYETAPIFEDMMRIVGIQEANIGGTSNGTATEAGIAESGRNSSIGLDNDDLDDMLSDLMRAAGQVMLMNLTEETVKTIVGPGAVWPTLTKLQVMQEVSLEVKAGSSGRPNQASEAAKFERLYPLLLSTPGISPKWLAERAIRIADDDIDLNEAIIEGLPSILAQNQVAAQPPTGNPTTDPASQGGQGGQKAQAPRPGGTGQPGHNTGPNGSDMS